MLESGLQDKVPHVLWGALALLRTLVGHFTAELAPVEVRYTIAKLMPYVVRRLGDSNQRTSQACEQT